MSAKTILNMASVRFFIILMFTILLTMSIVYLISTASHAKQLKAYKKSFYTEQTYVLSTLLGASLTGSSQLHEQEKLFDNLAKSYAVQFKVLSPQVDEVFYETSHEEALEGFVELEAPIIVEGELFGYIQAYYDENLLESFPALRKYEQNLNGFWNSLFKWMSLAAVIFAFAVAYFYRKSMKATMTASTALLQGKRDIKVPKTGTYEMDCLVENINTVLEEFNHVETWRKQMMEDLTHEIRTPLTSVLLTTEAIIDGVYPMTTENLQKIYKEVERLSRLILNVQNLSEAESARFGLAIAEANVISLIKDTFEGFLFVAAQKNIKMRLNLTNKPCVIDMDEDRFVQVITNLMSNALKYTEDGGKVEVGLTIHTNEIVFYCLDNGIGISDEEQVLVFNRFYRVEKSRSSEISGSGIGLNISHALARAHGWEMGVESELGVGSTFTVTIPLKTKGPISSMTD